jgi:hypothetical protein
VARARKQLLDICERDQPDPHRREVLPHLE